MRLRIEATPDELASKSEVLVKALVETLSVVAPDLAERLEKAIPKDIPKLNQPALREIHEKTRREYEARLRWMVKDIEAVLDKAVLVKSDDLAKAGPFVGPRGGKWADSKHTIPWKEQKTKTPSFKVKIHPVITGGTEVTDTFYIVSKTTDTVRVSRHEDSKYGPVMPKESLKHFINDLAGKVDLPKSGRADIDAVIGGKAKLLGKGDDGLAFKVGAKVVKVSTTVPFNPENPGHRAPQQAVDMLKKQVDTGNLLADKGIKGVQRSEFVQHGDKGFQIKPWVEIPEKLTRAQLDQIQETVHAIHDAGYAIRDTIQAGIDANKNPVLFDVGKAGPKSDATGIHSDEASDLDSLSVLYRDNGEKFVNTRHSAGQKFWDKAIDMRMQDKAPVGLVNDFLQRGATKLKEEAKTTMSGKGLADRIKEIDSELEFFRMEEKTKKAEGDEPGEKEEELEPGDIDPDTGEEVPEEEEPEPEEESEEEAG